MSLDGLASVGETHALKLENEVLLALYMMILLHLKKLARS
jgi:hypothetical protein